MVEFSSQEDAESSIAKFSGYMYGGRPLGLTFVKYLNAQGAGPGDVMEGTEHQHPEGLTQDQIM